MDTRIPGEDGRPGIRPSSHALWKLVAASVIVAVVGLAVSLFIGIAGLVLVGAAVVALLVGVTMMAIARRGRRPAS